MRPAYVANIIIAGSKSGRTTVAQCPAALTYFIRSTLLLVSITPGAELLPAPGSCKTLPVGVLGGVYLFSRRIISRTQSFQENRPFIFQARVVLKPLVSLIGRLVACISVDTQTDKPTTVALVWRRCRSGGDQFWRGPIDGVTVLTLRAYSTLKTPNLIGPFL